MSKQKKRSRETDDGGASENKRLRELLQEHNRALMNLAVIVDRSANSLNGMSDNMLKMSKRLGELTDVVIELAKNHIKPFEK